MKNGKKMEAYFLLLGKEMVERLEEFRLFHDMDRIPYIDGYSDGLEGRIPLYRDKYIRKLLKEQAN